MSTRTSPHPVIESIEVSAGYFAGTTVALSEGLTCVIGGKGAGKSTLLDLARFAVGAPAPDTRLQAADAMVKANLGSGRVTLRIRTRHGLRYQVSRAIGEPPRVLTDKGEVAEGGLATLFKLDTTSPRHLETVATSAAAQLALLDGFFEADARRLAHALEMTLRSLERNATEGQRASEEIAAEQGRVSELASVDERLRGLAEVAGPDAASAREAYEAKALRSRERTALEQGFERLERAARALAAAGLEVERALGEPLDPTVEEGPRREAFRSVLGQLQGTASAVREGIGAIQARLATAQAQLASVRRTLTALHLKEDEGYDALVAKLDEDRGRASERARLLEQRGQLSAAPERLSAARREEARLREERAKLLGELAALRSERFARREHAAAELTARLVGDAVRVSVTENGDREAYVSILKSILKGAVKAPGLVPEIAKRIRPEDLVAAVEHDDPSTLLVIDDAKTGKEERARRILETLRASGRLYEVQTVGLEDAPRIETRVEDVWAPVETASMGECLTCVLAILLLQGDSPLILDEPEVHLDNEFVSRVLVPNLAHVRGGRQLLVITHNANIPVLGLAERILVLEGNKKRGRVAAAGTLEELHGRVEARMEGGREAFQTRAGTYGYDLGKRR